MKTAKGGNVFSPESNTKYMGCAIYMGQSKKVHLQNVVFENCSFRTDLHVSTLLNCKFENCNFSGDFIYVNEYGVKRNTIPYSLSFFPQITHLRLAGLDITDVGIFIRHMKGLRVLDLSENKIRQIPTEVCELENLEVLNVSQNQLVSLPKYLSKLKKLHTIHARRNILGCIPTCIGKIENLKKVDMSHNRISNITDSFCQNKTLEEVNISYCRIGRINKKIANMKSLKNLNLSDNFIRTIPGEISSLNHLEELELHTNDLTKIHKHAFLGKSLEFVDVSNNRKLEYLPKDMSKSLKEINAIYCNPMLRTCRIGEYEKILIT